MSRPRLTGVVLLQDSNASRAARTAASTSSAPARGIVAHGCAVYGLMLSKVAPERASTHSPPMSILYDLTSHNRKDCVNKLHDCANCE